MRPRNRPLPSIEELRSTFTYNPQTGELFRQHKPGQTKFNTRYCSAPTGTVMNLGYLFVSTKSQMLLAHRVAWALYYGRWPKMELDHIDRDRLNNKIDNLREVTRLENMQNISRPYAQGVTFKKNDKSPWKAQIRVDGKKRWIGSFNTEAEAAAAYKVVENLVRKGRATIH